MSDNIRIDISKDKMLASIRMVSDETPTMEEVINKLKSAGITHGLIPEALQQCSVMQKGEPLVIAKGDPPTPGENGWVELLWDQKKGNCGVEEEETIDYRETSNLCSVNEGDLLAQKHPPTKGKPGRAVTGEYIMPPDPREAVITLGRGVRLSSDGNKVYSTIQGMPVAKKSAVGALIKVDHSYTVSGDVSMKTGNIRFKGDVVVSGNVTETMIVEASGNITVAGIVTGAKIMCGESLVVHKNIISSEIIAGMGAVECGKIKYIMEDLFNDLKNLIKTLEQMKDKLAAVDKLSFAQVVHGLIEKHFKNIKVNTKQLINIGTFNLPFEVVDALEAVKIIVGVSFDHKDFKDLMYHLDKAIKVMDLQEFEKASITAKAVHGSTINCSGEVHIIGKGCVNTDIYSVGNVKIVGPFKGGQIVSEGNVELDELGSGLGSPALVRVKSKNHIKAKNSKPGSVIQIGSNRLKITQELSAAKFVLNSNGETIDIV